MKKIILEWINNVKKKKKNQNSSSEIKLKKKKKNTTDKTFLAMKIQNVFGLECCVPPPMRVLHKDAGSAPAPEPPPSLQRPWVQDERW